MMKLAVQIHVAHKVTLFEYTVLEHKLEFHILLSFNIFVSSCV